MFATGIIKISANHLSKSFMKNHLFDKLKPKENKFFLLLHEMGEFIVTAADLIIECVQVSNHNDAVAYYRKIKDLEHKADAVQAEIFEELNNTFITPFDREDINDLSSTMDDIMDLINSCAKRIMLYNPKQIPESATTLAKLVRESAGFLMLALEELETFKKRPAKIKEYCVQLEVVEKKADDVYEHFLINLFENEKDAVEVIKLKDILHELEKAADAAQAVGKILKTVIIKYT
jgi:predicted phosphate transport protein (TIGR00153 family)